MKKGTRSFLLACLFLVPLLAANKGCEKPFEHPVVGEGMECGACHEDGRTRETRPAWHDLGWLRNHGQQVRKFGFKPDTKTTCYLCHSESTCSSCHQQEKPRDHNEFWRLKGHGLMVGLDRSRCSTCHRGEDFCQRCHSQTTPQDHTALWGAPSDQHCLSCHFPVGSAGAQRCVACHASTPSHTATPARPSNSLHGASANCRDCHTPLHHPDNGGACTSCHL